MSDMANQPRWSRLSPTGHTLSEHTSKYRYFVIKNVKFKIFFCIIKGIRSNQEYDTQKILKYVSPFTPNYLQIQLFVLKYAYFLK